MLLQIKLTVADYWGMYTNVNTDDVNHPFSVEHRDKLGIIRKPITGKLDLKGKLKWFIFDYLM